jgi:hypothetical protein
MNPQASLHHARLLIVFTLLLALLTGLPGTSWSSAFAAGEEWRPVDPAQLALKEATVEPNADAEAIFWDIKIDDRGNAGATSQYEVNMEITNDKTAVIYKRKFFFGGGGTILFPVDKYDLVKRLFDELHKADNHMITLKHATAGN